jgi:hypothetical protein
MAVETSLMLPEKLLALCLYFFIFSIGGKGRQQYQTDKKHHYA